MEDTSWFADAAIESRLRRLEDEMARSKKEQLERLHRNCVERMEREALIEHLKKELANARAVIKMLQYADVYTMDHETVKQCRGCGRGRECAPDCWVSEQLKKREE